MKMKSAGQDGTLYVTGPVIWLYTGPVLVAPLVTCCYMCWKTYGSLGYWLCSVGLLLVVCFFENLYTCTFVKHLILRRFDCSKELLSHSWYNWYNYVFFSYCFNRPLLGLALRLYSSFDLCCTIPHVHLLPLF